VRKAAKRAEYLPAFHGLPSGIKVYFNLHANVTEGQHYFAADVPQVLMVHTLAYRRWKIVFERFALILDPTISPRFWRDRYSAAIDGKPTRTYFRRRTHSTPWITAMVRVSIRPLSASIVRAAAHAPEVFLEK
jgi:hypothetical protein